MLVLPILMLAGQAFAADSIKGQVLGGGEPIAISTVTLWAASADAPKQLAQTKTDNEGRFEVRSVGAPADSSLYLTAMGGVPAAHTSEGNNQAIALLAVVGNMPPANVVINEFTTIASVWTHAQFVDGMTIKAAPLQLRIAAGNVPNFVELATGGWGGTIQDSLNSSQTPTMANFAPLADLLSGCVTRVKPDAYSSFFEAAPPQGWGAPTNTLNAAEAIALFPRHQPDKLYALLRQFLCPLSGKRQLHACRYKSQSAGLDCVFGLPGGSADGLPPRRRNFCGYFAGPPFIVVSETDVGLECFRPPRLGWG